MGSSLKFLRRVKKNASAAGITPLTSAWILRIQLSVSAALITFQAMAKSDISPNKRERGLQCATAT
jgi:hypothetical protein